MVKYAQSFRSSSSRVSKRQQEHNQINEEIVREIAEFKIETDAETIWLTMKGKGHSLSISSFYNRLKELIDAEIIVKKPISYNKYVYSIICRK